jgi:hypothetical protein
MFLTRVPELRANLHMPSEPGVAGRRMVSTVNEDKLRRILSKMLDEGEFFSPYLHSGSVAVSQGSSLRLQSRRHGVPCDVPAG